MSNKQIVMRILLFASFLSWVAVAIGILDMLLSDITIDLPTWGFFTLATALLLSASTSIVREDNKQ